MLNKHRLIGLLVIIVVIVVAITLVKRNQQAKAEEPIIHTGAVERGSVVISVSGTGILQPLTTVQVKSNVGGQIVQLAVDEGDRVTANQLIARIDPADTISTLDQVRADLDSARSRVTQAQENITIQRVQQSSQLESAEQAVKTAKLRLAQAEKQAKLQVTTTAMSIQQAQQAVESARARLAQAEEQARIQPRLTDSSIKQAQSNLNAATSSLQQTKMALAPQKLTSAQASYDQAKAGYDLAQKELARLKELLVKGFVARGDVDSAEERFAVAKAQLDTAKHKLDTVNGETEEDLRAAEAKVEQAEAALNTAEVNRAQDTLKLQDVTTARATVKQAEASLKVAEANREQDSLKAQDVEAMRAALKQAEASLATVRVNAHQEAIKRGDLTQAQAQVKRSNASVTNAETQLQYTTITAPNAGVVMKKYVEEGSIVTAGRSSIGGSGEGVALVEIADISKMFIVVNIDETDIAQIDINQDVDITIDAYPDELFFGKVTKIAPSTITEQNVTTVPVTIEIEAPDFRLKPGMNATCDFVTARHKDVLIVPLSALKETDDGTVVMRMVNGKQVPMAVRIGLTDNDNAEITSGLSEGQTIVTEVIIPQKPTVPTAMQGQRPGGMGMGMGGGGMRGGGMRGGR